MHPIKVEKLQAMEKHKKAQFLNNLILYSFTALIFALFCSYLLWFPPLFSSVNHFFFVSIPKFQSFFFSSKCLFIVGNVIIVFLVGKSKFSGSFSSPVTEIYDEYVERSQSLQAASMLREKKEEGKLEMNLTDHQENLNMIQEEKHIAQKQKEERIEDDHEEEEEEEEEAAAAVAEERDEEEEKEEESGLPVDELNRRVEDFIARVNRQRWLEDKATGLW